MGGPVVDWLLDGFNAVVLSYGQANAGKTSLLLGRGGPITPPSASSTQNAKINQRGEARTQGSNGPSPACGSGGGNNQSMENAKIQGGREAEASSQDGLFSARKDSADARLGLESGRNGGGEGGGGGLVRDILRAIFDRASSADATLRPEVGDFVGKEGAFSGISRDWYDSAGIVAGPFGGEIFEPRNGGPIVVALSAWEVSGKAMKDLFRPSPVGRNNTDVNRGKNASLSSTAGTPSVGPPDQTSGNGIGCSSTGFGGAGRNNSGGQKSSGSQKGGEREGEGDEPSKCGGGHSRGGRGRRKGRSSGGSGDDYFSSTSGWPPGYPDEFLTVQVPNLATALNLVDLAHRRCSERTFQEKPPLSSSLPSSLLASLSLRTGEATGGGVGATGAEVEESNDKAFLAATTAAAGGARGGHAFFRVVVYNSLEETVSTLHVVDVAGGWEVSWVELFKLEFELYVKKNENTKN